MAISEYIYKTPPFDHQRELMELSADKEVFAKLMEQGTGKSKPTVDTAAYLYEEGEIRAFVVIAPNGVHTKWATEDIPLSLPDRITRRIHVWRNDGTKRNQRGYDRLLNEPGDHLRILLINIEYMAYEKGADLVYEFIKKFRTLLAIDESVSIMTPSAKRTDRVINLGGWAEFRRILTGTPIVKAPFDLYSQFNFLDRRILNEPNYGAFKKQYGEFYPPHHPFVLNLACKQNPKLAAIINAQRANGVQQKDLVIPKWATYRLPPILMQDEETGLPKYKNLSLLRKLIEPYSFRRTKAECFDLPPKIYQTRFFTMSKEQRAFYDDIKELNRGILEDELVIIDHKLTVQLRLHQIACGYMPVEGEEVPFFKDELKNPRVQAVLDELAEWDGQQIIWCRFKREVRVLKRILGDAAVTHYGDTENVDGEDKETNRARFKAGEVKYLIGTAPSGGIGHNFANSSKAVFASNTFSYYHRAQAEDRQHRSGLADDVEKVLYVDIQAEDSVDQDIVASIKLKQDLADYMMGRKAVNPGAWLYDE